MKLKGERDQLLAIENAGFDDVGTPVDDDLLLNITIRVEGYSARDQVWVVSGDWSKFISEMNELERVRKGKATLKGASPNDLSIKFEVRDPAGHMAVSGFMGWQTPDGFTQKLDFGFEFDAGMLDTVVREVRSLGKQNRSGIPAPIK